LKEIVSNLDDNVLRCRETIDQFTKLTDRAKELWNSIIKTMESSLPKDTNPAAEDTAADQEAATSEADMRQQLEQFLENSDVKQLSNDAGITEISESLNLIDVFNRKTKVVYDLLQRYAHDKQPIKLTDDELSFYQEIKAVKMQIRQFHTDSDVNRLTAWAQLIQKEWTTGKHSLNRVYARWSKHLSQFFEVIQTIKNQCKIINESVTKFNQDITQQQLDGLVEALRKHLSDPLNEQDQSKQDKDKPIPDELQQLREKFMNDPLVEKAAKTNPPFKSETMKSLVDLCNAIGRKLAPVYKKRQDLQLDHEKAEREIDKQWKEKYPDVTVIQEYLDLRSRVSASDMCNYLLGRIQAVYTECTNLTADKEMILQGIQMTTAYPNYEKKDQDLLDELTKVSKKIDEKCIDNICHSLKFLRRLIDANKSADSDQNDRKPSGDQAGDQQRPEAQDGDQNGGEQHVDTDDEPPDDDDDHRVGTPLPSPAASRSASPTPPTSPAHGSPPPAHAYGRRVNPEHNGVLTYYVLYFKGCW
jgi:hypothetical protein